MTKITYEKKNTMERKEKRTIEKKSPDVVKTAAGLLGIAVAANVIGQVLK